MEPRIGNQAQLPEGVFLQPLTVISNERGAVLHMLRNDSPHFQSFGEIYFSEVCPGKIKAWKRHLRMTQHLTVPVGRVKFVLYDNRGGSMSAGTATEIELGRPQNYQLLVIPPMVWYGFKGLGTEPSLVANCTDLPHDPKESESISPDAQLIRYDW